MRGPIVVFVIAVLSCVAVCAEDAELRIPEDEAAYGTLFPFGVRGLPATYREVPGGDARLQAMQLGCKWLVAHQAPDGSFPADNLSWCNGKESTTAPTGLGKNIYITGTTGLALSALLGTGYSPRGKHPYAEVIRRGLNFIIKGQDKDGCLTDRRSQQYNYNHAFCLLALLDAYAVTGSPRLKQAIMKGIAFTEKARNPGSAWRYGIRPGDSDTSLTGCMGLPLVAAHKINLTAAEVGYVAPFDVPSQTFEGARHFVEAMTDQEYGTTGYLSRGAGSARPQEMLERFPSDKTEAMTAIGMMIRQIVPGEDLKHDQKMLKLGMRLLTQNTPRWSSAGTCDFYYWYYGSLATAGMSGSEAEDWQRAFAREVIQNQRKDGDACMYAGSWDDADPWGPDGGRMYSTAILMLGLQAPDRMRKFRKGRKDLTEALLEPELDVDMRADIVSAVGHHRVEGADRVLADAIQHKSAVVRVAAATALGETVDSPKSAKLLVGALSDKDRTVLRAVAQALCHARPLPEGAVAPLLVAFKEHDDVLRTHVAHALGGAVANPEVDAALRKGLTDPSTRVKVAAAGSLWAHKKDPAFISIWFAALKDKDPDARAEGAMWLERAGPDAVAAKEALRAALTDKVAWVRARAALALQAIAADDPALPGAFAALLNETEPRVQMLALKALTRLGAKAAPATLALVRIARTAGMPLQRLALGVLTAIGPGADKAAPALWFLAEEGDVRLRPMAKRAIEHLKLDPRRATAIYISKLDYKDKELARGAIAGLRAVGSPAVPALVAILSDKDPHKRVGIMRALSGMGEHAAPAMPQLRQHLAESKTEAVRAWAARTLGTIGPKARPAVSWLIAQLDDRTQSVAVESARAIGLVGSDTEGAVTALSKLLMRKGKREELAPLHAAALFSLGKAGAAGEPVFVDMLRIAATREQVQSVRNAALQGCKDLGMVGMAHLRAALTKGSVRFGNEAMGQAACQVIAHIGPDASDAIDDLIEFLIQKRGWRDAPGDALVAMGKPALKPLLKLLKHTAFEIRTAAVRAVGLLGPIAKSYAGSVRRLRKDPHEDVRAAAEKAYLQIKKRR